MYEVKDFRQTSYDQMNMYEQCTASRFTFFFFKYFLTLYSKDEYLYPYSCGKHFKKPIIY